VVIINVMALRRPVISTYVAGIPELVRPSEHGWLVPAGDVEALAEAMRACLDTTVDILTHIGAVARDRVLARHDVDTEAKKLGKLLGSELLQLESPGEVAMLSELRERVKRLPVIGPRLYRLYLTMFYGEGEVIDIRGGPLAGMRWIRFMRTYHDAYVKGSYEPAVQAALAKYLHPGAVFYDIGANAGFFSLLGASLVGASGKVVSFEPHPETARQLKQQIDINELHQVDVVVTAVSNRIGTAEFSDDTSSVMAALTDVRPDRQGRFKIRVKLTTIDEELHKRPAPDVIKIDVEGAELDVLQGARGLLHDKKPMLLVEIHSPEIAREYDRLMEDFSYESWSLSGAKISVAESGERFVLSRPASAGSTATSNS